MEILIAFLIVYTNISHSIPENEIDIEKIYIGSAINFDRPAEVNFQKIVDNSPEKKEIVRKNIESNTGKYWILLSQATDTARRALENTASEKNYDFVSQKGYLNSLTKPISVPNITDFVLEKLEENDK